MKELLTSNLQTDPNICGDDGPITAEECALWLDAKYRRHGELEDRAAAMWLRKLSVQSVPETPLKPQKCAADMYADPPRDCNAPYCGCNPAWTQCLEMLQECGWQSPDEVREKDDRIRALTEALTPFTHEDFDQGDQAHAAAVLATSHPKTGASQS